MRFLVDECTGPAVAGWFRTQGHEVFSVYEEARGMEDERAGRKVKTMRRLLEGYADRLAEQFVTVTETQVRFAHM